VLPPRVEVVLHVDRATDTLVLADRPVLLERPGAVDAGLVVAGAHEDVILVAVGIECALVLSLAAGIVRAVRLDDIVLDERVAGPAIDGQVAVALGVEVTTVVDRATGCQYFLDITCLSGKSDQQGHKTYRPVPGFQPLPPTKLPVLRHLTW
jgi:hypothetical protein